MAAKLSDSTKRQAYAVGRSLRTSPYRLNLVAHMIRGKPVEKALNDLRFAPQRAASFAFKVLNSAVANAENNHSLDIDSLFVAEAYVGKNLVMKRWRPRARGRTGSILKPFSQITIVLREDVLREEAKDTKHKKETG